MGINQLTSGVGIILKASIIILLVCLVDYILNRNYSKMVDMVVIVSTISINLSLLFLIIGGGLGMLKHLINSVAIIVSSCMK